MLPTEVTVEVLDGNLNRVGQVLPADWDATFTSNLRAVGAWQLTLPVDRPMCAVLDAPGSGILVTGPQGELFSGPVVSATEKGDQDDPSGSMTFVGADFLQIIADALAWPTPTTADLTAQSDAYDNRSGVAETVIRSLIDANIGPSAPSARKARLASLLQLAIDQVRGPSITSSTRFDPLLDTAAQLGSVAGLGFRVTTSDGHLHFGFFEPADRTAEVRLDIANGTLSAYEAARSAPTVTDPIVAGQGEGNARTFLARTSADATAAELAWGRRIEKFIDQRQTDDPVELAQAGDEALADGGATGNSLKLTPTDDMTMRYGRDWFLGDFITAVTSRGETPQVVSKVGIKLGKDGVTIGAQVGDLDADDVATLQLRRRLGRLETRT